MTHYLVPKSAVIASGPDDNFGHVAPDELVLVDREAQQAERDEARAEVARLQDLHTRCAAFDDQPGPSCVTLKAQVARLREALEAVMGIAGGLEEFFDGAEGTDARRFAEDALAETGDEGGK